MLKHCFSLPTLLYFLRTSTCFIQSAFSEKYDKTVRDWLFKKCNMNFNNFLSAQQARAAEMGGLGVPSASFLALPIFWPQLLVRVTFWRRFSSMMFRLRNRSRNGWIWEMNRKIVWMQPRNMRHILSMSNPHKIWFLDWMPNVRKFLPLVKANSDLNDLKFLAST